MVSLNPKKHQPVFVCIYPYNTPSLSLTSFLIKHIFVRISEAVWHIHSETYNTEISHLTGRFPSHQTLVGTALR